MKDTHKTIVVFRKFKDDGSILALFPNDQYSDRGTCYSYMHMGQHSGAEYTHCVSVTKPAKPKEYAALKKELESIGYDLDIRVKYIPKRNSN